MANNWTRGAAHRRTTAPISALGLHPVTRELLLISRPAEGRRPENGSPLATNVVLVFLLVVAGVLVVIRFSMY